MGYISYFLKGNDRFATMSVFQVMIPLSLYVTLEMAKLLQVYHIHNDIDMYDPETNKKIECRALNISEEVGQVGCKTVWKFRMWKVFLFYLVTSVRTGHSEISSGNIYIYIFCSENNSEMQQLRFILRKCFYSTCFGWQSHPSSGVHVLYMATG